MILTESGFQGKMILCHTAGNPILKYLILQPLKVGNVPNFVKAEYNHSETTATCPEKKVAPATYV